MALIAWVLIFTIMRILLADSQFSTNTLFQRLNQDKSRNSKEFSSNDLDHDLLTTKMGIEDVLKSILKRYRERLRERMGPRMLVGESINDRRIAEICGTSASLECGEKVLKALTLETAGQDENDFRARCDTRKKFLECIDNQRYACGKLAKEGVFPILPPKKDVQGVQEKVWKSLWTSGGCVLGI